MSETAKVSLRTMEINSVWRTYHYNLCELLQVNPSLITTKRATELAAQQVGIITGMMSAVSEAATEYGFEDLDSFYEAYAEYDIAED